MVGAALYISAYEEQSPRRNAASGWRVCSLAPDRRCCLSWLTFLTIIAEARSVVSDVAGHYMQ